jgi:aspartate-semialdehyde dehydrogenase
MLRMGFIGSRGMVGSVLLDRMIKENDFKGFEPFFFSTSDVGGKSPDIGTDSPPLCDAFDIKFLSSLDIIISCQGGDYTNKIYRKIRKSGWKGYWIDAASTLRMEKESVIVLDPVNKHVIDDALKSGVKTFIGGNCTVSLMLMALSGLFKMDYIDWISSMTYQAASGAGAGYMIELVKQMSAIGESVKDDLKNPAPAALEIDKAVSAKLKSSDFPVQNVGAPLAASLIPWIDSAVKMGQTREEWKGFVETNKILNTKRPILIDGICVRVGSMRCHSQALTIKLNKDIPVSELSDMIKNGNKWVKFIPNNKEETLKYLTPAAVTGGLEIAVGRIRKSIISPKHITLFTVGDQLLWGAAEPLRRIFNIIRNFEC